MIPIRQSLARDFFSRRLLQLFNRLFIVVLPLLVNQVNLDSVVTNWRTAQSVSHEFALQNRKLGLRADCVSNRYKANRRVIKRLIIQRYRSLNRGPGEGFVRSVAPGNQPTDRYDQRKAVSDDCPQTFNKHCDQ